MGREGNGTVHEPSSESEAERIEAAIDRLEAIDVIHTARIDMLAREVGSIKKALSSRVAIATALMVLAGSVSSVWQGVKPLVDAARAGLEARGK